MIIFSTDNSRQENMKKKERRKEEQKWRTGILSLASLPARYCACTRCNIHYMPLTPGGCVLKSYFLLFLFVRPHFSPAHVVCGCCGCVGLRDT